MNSVFVTTKNGVRAARWRRAFWALAGAGLLLSASFPICWVVQRSRRMTYEAALEALNDPRCANPLAAASRVRILIGEGIDGLKRQRTPECEALLRQIQKDLNR